MKYELVVVGTSLGGFEAIERLLRSLPKEFRLPVAIVQHRSIDSDRMSEILQRKTGFTILECEDKQPILPGIIYLAPPDYHLLVEPGMFSLSCEGPVSYARPSIDVLFESAADSYREKVIGIILTGANRDGARGAEKIKQRGGYLIVQEPASAESAVMPKAAINITKPDQILDITEIGRFLAEVSDGE